ncbi:MAG: arginyltransferase [Polyangiaceae bacterium]|nr:arginyltransferase [Polyangiaceae bacterium]
MAEPPVLLVHDGTSDCPYLPGRIARTPMQFPIRELTRAEVDRRLAAGYRRQGVLLYNVECPACSACEPIRLRADTFKPNKTQRRVYRRCSETFEVEIGEPEYSDDRLALYNRHKFERGLARSDLPMTPDGYRSFLVARSCEAFEIRYRRNGVLCGIAVTDRGETSLSAVYTYYDPSYEPMSLGVFSVLTQVELCKQWGLTFMYLGLYIEGSEHMSYKATYMPHERLIGGQWRTFEKR